MPDNGETVTKIDGDLLKRSLTHRFAKSDERARKSEIFSDLFVVQFSTM